MTQAVDRIPLGEVAEDARALVAAFREAGEVSFQDVPLADSRANYRRACAANGLPPAPVARIKDHQVAVDGGEITVREYRPAAGDAVLPALFFIHGGGWVIGDLDTHDPICRALAVGSEASVFAVDYRLAPEHPFPTPLDDCVKALGWLADNAATLEVDPKRIAGVGDSAGGNLVAVLANEAALRPTGVDFHALALFYPVTDLSRESTSYARIQAGFPLTAAAMRWFSGHYLANGSDVADPSLSPLLAQRLSRAPLFIVSCGLDPLSDEAIAYAAAAARSGARVEHHHLPHHAHGLFTSAGKIATGARLTRRAADFLSAMLRS